MRLLFVLFFVVLIEAKRKHRVHLPKEIQDDVPKDIVNEHNENVTIQSNGVKRMWLDLASAQLRNIAVNHHRPRMMRQKNKPEPEAVINKYTNIESGKEPDKDQYFSIGSFDLASNVQKDNVKWTTCDEFGRTANFHPKDLVNIDWLPFYVWTTRTFYIAIVHRFSYPTKKLVKRYKDEFGPYLNKSIDWEQPKLVMNGMAEMLLIAADRRGLFHAIVYNEIPDYIKKKTVTLPALTIRFKIEEPYLAMVYCEEQFAAIMAVAGNEPTTNKQRISEAKTLNFKGTGYPVYRDLEMEKNRMKAENDWKRQNEENKFLNVDVPIIRDHFLGRD